MTLTRLLILTVLCAVPVSAQFPRDTTRGKLPDTTTVPPVTITATRITEPLMRVPYAISVATPRDVQSGLTLQDALSAVPGLQIDNRFNFAVGERISMRGIGARSQFGVRGVRVFVNGIPATFADGQSALDGIDPRFITRAEVIRGAASMLYGNASGGALLLSTDRDDDTLSTIGGSYSTSGGPLSIYASLPASVGNGRTKVLASFLKYDGWRDHSDAIAFRGSMRQKWEIGDNDRIALNIGYTSLDASNPGSLTRAAADSAPRSAYIANVTQQTGKVVEQVEFGMSWQHLPSPIGFDAALFAISRRVDNPIIGRTIKLHRNAIGGRASSRGSFDAGLFRWSAGFDVEAQLDDRENSVPLRNGVIDLDQFEQVIAIGPFVSLTYAPLQALSLRGTVRYDNVAFRVKDRIPDSIDVDDSGERAVSAFSPALAINWMLFDNVAVFANVATAFETPTTTELANRPSGAGGFNPDLNPQRSMSFEIGFREHVVLSAMRVDTTMTLDAEIVAYNMTVTNELIPYDVPDTSGRQFYRNAGSAAHRGLELSATLTGLAGMLHARLAYSLIDARFQEFVVGESRYDGNRIPGVAPLRISGLLDYRIGALTIEYSIESTFATPVDDANSAESDQYILFGLRLAYSNLRIGRLGFRFFAGVDNIGDASYTASIVPNANGGRYYEPGRERAVFGGLELKF